MSKPLTPEALTDNELELLIGLLMVAVNADDVYTSAEAGLLKRVATEIGRERFVAAGERLRERCPDPQSVLAAVDEVQRPAARALIRTLVTEACEVDGVARQEEHLLTWLARRWPAA